MVVIGMALNMIVISLRGRNAFSEFDNATYSASEVDNVALCCSCDFHIIGQPPSMTMYPVLDRTLMGSVVSSLPYNPQKSASTYRSKLNCVLFGLMMIPCSEVFLR